MFCDLVGSTPLSSRLDPEDLREVIAAYHRAVAGMVAAFDGFVGRYMGDGVLVYFGYPQAHEDDAERAVRAGLELIAAVAELSTHASLQTRVGILAETDRLQPILYPAHARSSANSAFASFRTGVSKPSVNQL